MGFNDTPSGERIHIGFFGCRNAGKSSLVNAITGQELSVVSDVPGTTTDPVKKTMELLPLGPVVLIDTPGFDDIGSLGELRIKKTRQILEQSDMAVLVMDAAKGMQPQDQELLTLIRERDLPYLMVYNKCDLTEADEPKTNLQPSEIYASAKNALHIQELKETLARLIKPHAPEVFLCGDLFHPGDTVLLVIPIDKAAPKGRLILPQQMAIRDILDHDGIPVCVKEDRLAEVLSKPGIRPALVITDSQVFGLVSKIVPADIPLTSFSILMARHKGFLKEAVSGAARLRDMHTSQEQAATPSSYRILIAEGCTHHRQCDDIGTVKIPRWLKQYIGTDISVDTCSGQQFPEDLSGYDLVIHCGGCMLGEREVQRRMKCAMAQGIPFTNYGIAIAQFQGILRRSIAMFPDIANMLE